MNNCNNKISVLSIQVIRCVHLGGLCLVLIALVRKAHLCTCMYMYMIVHVHAFTCT